MSSIIEQLVAMSNGLGDPAMDCAILGEGNTSARADAKTFWVKASGTELRTIDAAGFVRVAFEPILAMLEAKDLSDEEIKQRLRAARVDPATGGSPSPQDGVSPSVETVLHALCLQVEGINFVGHTHPTAINALTCSASFETAVSGRLFPDEIVILGVAPVVVPYTDPGLPLARAIGKQINQYLDRYHEPPRLILMQNHGMIALGRSAQQVENITLMAGKWARILMGTYALGGPHFLTPANVARIHTRPDEHYRRRLLGG